MPGSGKTTIGRPLAEELQLPFIDLDEAIETECNQKVTDIFREKGEDFFRLKESELLRKFASSQDSFVLSTGGGAPCHYDGIDVINTTGISIFLDVAVNELVQRVLANKDRPLLSSEDEQSLREKVTRIYESRRSTYSQASIVVENPNLAKVLKALRG